MTEKKFICPERFKQLLFVNLTEQRSRAMVYNSEEEGCNFKVIFDNEPDVVYHVMEKETVG